MILKNWYNYKTQEYDYGDGDRSDYIPQDVTSQSLYALYVESGESPLNAIIKVSEIHAGKGED